MPLLQPSLSDFWQIKFSNSTNGISAKAISDAIVPPDGCRTFPPSVRVLVLLNGTITNTDLQVSLGMTDSRSTEGWSAPQIAEIRTLPDSSAVMSILTFETLRAYSLRIAVENDIAGGGSVKVFCSFKDGE